MSVHDDDTGMEHDFQRARRGAVIAAGGKTRVTMYLDNDVLAHFRRLASSNGRGYQTEINECLRRMAMVGEEREANRAQGQQPAASRGASAPKPVGAFHIIDDAGVEVGAGIWRR